MKESTKQFLAFFSVIASSLVAPVLAFHFLPRVWAVISTLLVFSFWVSIFLMLQEEKKGEQ